MNTPRGKNHCLPLPSGWKQHVARALREIAAMTHYAVTYTRSWSADSPLERVRLRAELERVEQELAVVREIERIKSARIARIPAHRRPRYDPPDRLAILELRAANGWTKAETARIFQISEATVADWEARLEAGDDRLLLPPVPVNKFPDFVRLVVNRLKATCPIMGKVKIAQLLARAGLHLAVNTVGRALKDRPKRPPCGPEETAQKEEVVRVVTAKRPNHVWHIDMTEAPITGLWTPWIPNALPQVWPFVWHVIAVVDHYSRACLGFAVFAKSPTSKQVTAFLDRTIEQRGRPKYIISDQGSQFRGHYRSWAEQCGIKLRFGKVGKHGSIAVIERFIRTMKDEFLRVIRVSFSLSEFRHELSLYVTWYNHYRPHTTLGGKTPVEVFEGLPAANELARIEPRSRYPRGSPCASPQAPVRGDPGEIPQIEIALLEGNKLLPIVRLRAAA